MRRELGLNWSRFLAFISGILTTLVGSIFFLLASLILYDLLLDIARIFSLYSAWISSLGKHWFSCILLFFFLLLSQLNSLELVVRYSFIGLMMIGIYLVTLLISFFQNIPHVDSNAFKAKGFTLGNLQYWLAVQGFSFLCHPTLDAVVRENSDKSKNGSAVVGGYIMTWFINLLVGVLGALALYGKHPKDNSSVVGYFEGQWQ